MREPNQDIVQQTTSLNLINKVNIGAARKRTRLAEEGTTFPLKAVSKHLQRVAQILYNLQN